MKALPRFLTSPRTAIAAATLLLLYVAAGFLLVPRLVANATHSFFQTHYHRRVELGHVAFNPLKLKLAVDHFVLPDADGGPLLAFDHLDVGLSLDSLFRGGLDLGQVALDRPRAHLVRRADGRLNIMDLVPPPDPQADPNAPPPRLWIHALAIRSGEASIVDQQPHGLLHVTLKPITFTLRDFSTRSEGNAYRLLASTAQGEQFEWLGTFGLRPLVSQGRFKVEHLQLRTLTANGLELAPLELAGGEMRLEGSYDLAEQADQLALKAQVAELLITSLALRPTGEQDNWVTAPRVAVKDTNIDLSAATVRVGAVLIEQPSLTAWRNSDGSVNLSRLVPAGDGGAQSGPAVGTPAAKPWQFAVADIRVTGADVSVEDRTLRRPAKVHLAPVELSISGYASPAQGPLTVTLDTGVNDGGRLTATGSLTLAPVSAKFAVDARALGLSALQPYLEQTTALTIKSGVAGLKGTATLGPGGAIGFQGDAEVDELRTIDNSLGQDFVNWQSLVLSGVRAQSVPAALAIREVVARKPYADIVIGANGITNVRIALRQPAAPAAGDAALATPALPAAPAQAGPKAAVSAPAAATPAAPAAGRAPATGPPVPVEIGIVRIQDGSMNFADFTVKPNFATGIYELAGTVRGLSSKHGSRATVDLAGKVDRYAPVTITGEVNFLAAVAYTDVTMSFKNLELTGLSPYSGRFAGYRIDRGKMSADLNYHVEGRLLSAKHRLSIHQLELGDRVDSADATKLPIKFAIALLKDRNGVIDLDLPVSGSLDDPQFQIGPVLWKLVVGVVTKVVTAPFALLGSLFGGSEELEFVDFAPGSAELDSAGRAKLAALVKPLDARPALNVDVPRAVAPALDSAALAARQWQEQLEARARARLGAHGHDPGAVAKLLATPKDYRALLEDAYRASFGHAAVVPATAAGPAAAPADPQAAAIAWLEGQLRPLVVLAPAALADLADARAAAVQSALLDGTGVDPTRVFIVKAAPLTSTNPPVRMQLALH